MKICQVLITAERWPSWREEMEFDAGPLFICYKGDPRSELIKQPQLFDGSHQAYLGVDEIQQLKS